MSKKLPIKPRARVSRKSEQRPVPSPKPRPRIFVRVTQHARVTAGRSHQRPVMGMFHMSRITHAGNTAHFDVSYLSSLGQQGVDLARAILQSCERDYAALQQIFGGLTPHRLPFVIQITSDNTGASHSSCMGTDIMVGGKSDGNVDFIRSLLVA